MYIHIKKKKKELTFTAKSECVPLNDGVIL